MIKAVATITGAKVDEPRTVELFIDYESVIAVKRRNEETKKLEQYTIEQLFDAYKAQTHSSYKKFNDPMVDDDLFTAWFSQKYIKDTNIEHVLLSLTFERVDT